MKKSTNTRARLGIAAAAMIAGLGATGAAAAAPATLEQWKPEIRDLFYYTPQGSRLMPYAWFVALERADGTEMFASPASLGRYGWAMPIDTSPLNPDKLPVGFVKDPVDQPGTGNWVGLTCAACHTGDITYKGAQIRVDGAPTQADFGRWLSDLNAAVQTTRLNADKFSAFAARVLGPHATSDDVTKLKQAYTLFATQMDGGVRMRTPSLAAGPGRVDALNQIINSMSVVDANLPTNLRDPAAPVSYPHLWLAPKLDWVQWNPVAANPIARNVGEVLGVFAHANFTGAQADLLKSTALIKQLAALEEWLTDLKPPVWPAKVFGRIDAKKAAKGEALFKRDCQGCHTMQPFAMTSPDDAMAGKTFIKIGRTDYRTIGTDPAYVRGLLARTTLTGDLSPALFNRQPVVPAADFFLTSVGAVVQRGLKDAGISDAEAVVLSGYRFYPPHSPHNGSDKPVAWTPPSAQDLKAGPLYGIWATGPFLHNGSVPNLYELLSPPEKRSKVFWTGSREFDPIKVGFRSERKPGLFRFDTTQPGNSNAGHVYPRRPYSEAEKMAVIEYLKSATLQNE